MATRSAGTPTAKPIEQYEHRDKTRPNNPPVGLVSAETDPEGGRKTYAYDPHLDPRLEWAGKAERASFEVPTVSLHVHERIDPRTVIEAVEKKDGVAYQPSLFEARAENPPLHEAVQFYKHAHGWSNRLIAGDSLLVMNSLLEKEGLGGQVQTIYVDPPYGVKYGSNFQPFVNRRDVKDGRDEDLTQEPEMLRAFRDTWELGIHSYLSYLRDQLLLARELLHESGSCFVQISDENLHHVREVMDEVFGAANFCSLIQFRKTSGASSPMAKTNVLGTVADYIVWYAKDLPKVKYRQLYVERPWEPGSPYRYVEAGGERRTMSAEEASGRRRVPDGARVFRLDQLSNASIIPSCIYPLEIDGTEYWPPPGRHWATPPEGMARLKAARRVMVLGRTPSYVRYQDDFGYAPASNWWEDTGLGGFVEPRIYVVQTNAKVISRCLLMSTDPGDLVVDPTCGSGTTAYVAEQWGRRWITCDTSRVALTLAKQRLMTASFDYYDLAHPEEGVGSGFRYRTVPHIMLETIANDEPPAQETLYDQPYVDRTRARVTGPFTVEAVPAPVVLSVDGFPVTDGPAAPARGSTGLTMSGGSGELITPSDGLLQEELTTGGTSTAALGGGLPPDDSVARSGPTVRQAEWRAELLRTGIRGKNGQVIQFSRVEPLAGTRWLHAEAETRPNDAGADSVKERQTAYAGGERVVISFGPDYAPLEQRQVERAVEEAWSLVPRPKLLVFAAFQFDPEAAKDVDETDMPGVTLLKVQMNADLLTADLKKKRASNESFWLVGQPDVEVVKQPDGAYQVEMRGFDYYNTKSGELESGDPRRVAMWLLDTDYDGRSLFPRQVFFPMAGPDGGWARLARDLKAQIDEDLVEAYRGTISLPFQPGDHRRVAVKIVDDRGIESLKIVELD